MPKPKPEEEIIKTTVRLRRDQWEKLRITAFQQRTTAEALMQESLDAILKKYAK
jgi:hypothetical protein